MELIDLLVAALKAAGVPIEGLQIKDVTDRRTWTIDFTKTATPEQRAIGAVLLASFDPEAPAVKEATQAEAARQAGESVMIKAFYRFWFYKANGADAVLDDKTILADRELLARCFKEAASS